MWVATQVKACKEAQKEAKVLVTNQNSKVVCIKMSVEDNGNETSPLGGV